MSINLLPIEFITPKKAEHRRHLITRASIVVLIFMILVTCTILIFMINLNQKLETANIAYEQQINKVTTLKAKEGLLANLKVRLDSIGTVYGKDSESAVVLNLILSLKPEQVKISSIIMTKLPSVIINGESTNSKELETFFNNLIDAQKNQGKIKSVKVSSLSRTINPAIRYELTLETQNLLTGK